VYEALRSGASGFLLKDASAGELAAAVRVVAAGDALPAITTWRESSPGTGGGIRRSMPWPPRPRTG